MMKRPELVLPAGNLEKLKTAILFGADAVYLGGKDFSLRAYAGNFTLQDMKEGLNFAHKRQKKVYVTANIFAHNKDLPAMPEYFAELEEMQVDGLIISDPGVLHLARRYAPSIPKTISTQANVTNYESAALYKELGAERIVLARELSIDEMQEIKNKVEIELEVFVHGAMCVSYSGRCLLSHFMTGRSANRGACAHPCRYSYTLVEEKRPNEYYPIEEDQGTTYILNSRDLCLIEYIPRLIECGIDSFKVEGRMKSSLYVASVAATYRKAIERYLVNPLAYTDEELSEWMDELKKTATRPFTNGFIEGESSLIQDIDKEEIGERAAFCGIAIHYDEQNNLVEVEQRANFGPGDYLEFMLPSGDIRKIDLDKLYDKDFNLLDRARHPQQRVLLPVDCYVPENSILRRVEAYE